MTRIIVRGHILTYSRERNLWECPKNKTLAEEVNATLDPLGPGGEDPHPPETAVLIAEDKFKATILEVDPRPPYKKGVVY